MTISLDEVRDIDCVASRDPLVLDLSASDRPVVGAEAIAQRVLSLWARDARLLEQEGTFSAGNLFVLRSRLAALAETVEFISRATVKVTFVEPSLQVSATLWLDDGTTARLEVTTGEAATMDFEVLT